MIVGIDPDLKRSGVATMRTGFAMALTTKKFFELHELLGKLKDEITMVYIEAGWLNTVSNFHHPKASKRVSDRISKNVGENHAVGKLIVEMCEALGLKYTLIKPSQSKWTSKMFLGATGINTKNQEEIDAGVLILGRTK